MEICLTFFHSSDPAEALLFMLTCSAQIEGLAEALCMWWELAWVCNWPAPKCRFLWPNGCSSLLHTWLWVRSPKPKIDCSGFCLGSNNTSSVKGWERAAQWHTSYKIENFSRRFHFTKRAGSYLHEADLIRFAFFHGILKKMGDWFWNPPSYVSEENNSKGILCKSEARYLWYQRTWHVELIWSPVLGNKISSSTSL